MIQGIRGAITVQENDKEQIFAAVGTLLKELLARNGIKTEEIGAAIFSATPDLNAAFPAAAARRVGWELVPLFGAQELTVEDAPARCVRVLLLVNTDKPQRALNHVYLGGAARLRPDLAEENGRDA